MDALLTFIKDFSVGFQKADARYPKASNARTKQEFRPGIGPHSESETVKLIMRELAEMNPEKYAYHFAMGVAYPEFPRKKCDLCLGVPPDWEWAIEVKMVRLFGDNGKLNDNILMHVLSPYPEHRSALTDCDKLLQSRIGRRKAILIYGYDYDKWPLDPVINAFEVLAAPRVPLGKKCMATFKDLVHPIHHRGRVFAWELGEPTF